MAAAEPRTACASLADQVVRLIAGARLGVVAEKVTQADLETIFVNALGAETVSREHRLGPADIPDFLIGGAIVVEVKGRRHRYAAVARQLDRYASYPEVTTLIVATARAMLLPPVIDGKPVRVINLARAWL